MVNFGLLAAEIISLVWGTPANFNAIRVLAALLHSQTAASNRGRHLYSAERPSRWALAYISSLGPAFAANRVQNISDLHSKFALGHTMCRSILDIQSAAAEIRRGKKDR